MSVYAGPADWWTDGTDIGRTHIATKGVVQSGLVLNLDAGVSSSYPGSGTTWYDISGNGNHFTLYNSPTFSSNKIIFNGTNQYAISASNINLSSFTSVTTMIFSRTTATTGGMMFEHTANWNLNNGGFGLGPHSNGNAVRVNLHHTNHRTSLARNYLFSTGTNWANHTNIFSTATDSTGRLTYNNGQLEPFSSEGGYGTTTNTGGGSFADSLMHIATRGGTDSYCPLEVGVFLIYNRKLSSAEIQQNFNALRGRFGI
jgi:hypothetical protein